MNNENEIVQESALIVTKADGILVDSPESCEMAVDFIKSIKSVSKKVAEFFAPMKTSAHKAWQAVVSREKEFVLPLETAEKNIRSKISNYNAGVEAHNREIERKRIEEEQRLLQERLDIQNALKNEGFQVEESDLPVISPVVVEQKISTRIPGSLSYRTDYNVMVYDEDKVPIMFEGVEIRPVDIKKLMEIARKSNGNANIPGVAFEIVKKPVVRRGLS